MCPFCDLGGRRKGAAQKSEGTNQYSARQGKLSPQEGRELAERPERERLRCRRTRRLPKGCWWDRKLHRTVRLYRTLYFRCAPCHSHGECGRTRELVAWCARQLPATPRTLRGLNRQTAPRLPRSKLAESRWNPLIENAVSRAVGDEDVQTGRDFVPVLGQIAASDVKCPMHILGLPRTAIDRQSLNVDSSILEVIHPSIPQERGGLAGTGFKQEIVIARDSDLVLMRNGAKPFCSSFDLGDSSGRRKVSGMDEDVSGGTRMESCWPCVSEIRTILIDSLHGVNRSIRTVPARMRRDRVREYGLPRRRP